MVKILTLILFANNALAADFVWKASFPKQNLKYENRVTGRSTTKEWVIIDAKGRKNGLICDTNEFFMDADILLGSDKVPSAGIEYKSTVYFESDLCKKFLKTIPYATVELEINNKPPEDPLNENLKQYFEHTVTNMVIRN